MLHVCQYIRLTHGKCCYGRANSGALSWRTSLWGECSCLRNVGKLSIGHNCLAGQACSISIDSYSNKVLMLMIVLLESIEL